MIAPALLLLTCEQPPGGATPPRRGPVPVVIHEVLANPRLVSDERGEWFEVRNLGTQPVDLRGWTIASGNDRDHVVPRSVIVPAEGFAVLAKEDGIDGVRAAYAYGAAIALGNGADWLALRARSGETVDSVAWRGAPNGASRGVRDAGAEHAVVGGPNWITSTSSFGAGDLGTPGAPNDAAVAASPRRPDARRSTTAAPAPAGAAAMPPESRGPVTAPAVRATELVVRVLDVGQGDAILVSNGGSTALIDGGPDTESLAHHLDRLALDGTTIDVVILTHQHYDHHGGLRELFRSRRRIGVRYFFENLDAYPNASLAQLRDSVRARSSRGELVVRDTDDPCGDGTPTCTITMRGGAKLHVLRPDPRGGSPNNRSAAVKLVGPDSASFTMWLAGDAEHESIAWFDRVGYDERPGMRSTVFKANHHGSCDGVTRRYLELIRPRAAVMSLAANNDYGYVHRQTTELLRAAGIPWYRTDQNGTVTIRSPGTPGGGFTIQGERGSVDARGPMDRASREAGCR